ncbi:uncharacterized protein LOC124349894 [Daphnia pulicaria]|uniref:uncharacterized protein LOC124349894 n=1 Tax=Daphnia pulicaria TaxID=35523 RepID=UPI001EEA32AD|nr:uncharacterized protein LOC124349894 [Daphnia pulicaria]
MRKKGLFKEANEKHSAENIPKKSRSNKKTLPAHVIEENNVEGFNSHEENCLKYFRTIMEDENKIASDERNLNKKLVKRGFQQPEISQYIKDVSSDNYNTNKHRMIRIMFLANQLARDAGVELLIFGYFPNVTVGSCAAWAFGEETKNFVRKPTAKSFLEHWENLFSLKEDIRQNPDKANVDVENEEPQTENVELNKEKEVVGVHVSHIGSEGESVELTNKESEAGGVESSNKKSFEPEQKHFPSHLIHGTQHPSSTFTVTLTQSEDGTYLPPPHLIDQLDAWGLGVSPSPIINTLAPPSSGQLLLEIATESTSDRTGASNVAASVLPVPVNGKKKRQNNSKKTKSSTSGENAQTKGQASPKRLPAELTAKAASNPSLLHPVTSSEAQVLITAVISAANTSIGNPVLRFRETGQPVTKNKDLTAGKKVRQKEQESQNHLPVEITTMTASNPSSFPPVTMSETQVLISSPSPPVSVVTIRSETPELPTPETGQWVKENGVLASSDSASASIFNQHKRKKCVESETSTEQIGCNN